MPDDKQEQIEDQLEEYNMIKNVIFDIGNVLVRFMPDVAMKQLGIPEDKIEAVLRATVNSKWWTEMDRGFLPEEALWQYMIEEAPQLREEILLFKEQGIDKVVRAFPYAADWMKELKERGFKTYLLSNYPKDFFECHSAGFFPFMPYIDGKIVSAYVEMIKPDPNIYRELLKTYDLKAQECVFIDDRRENIEAARQLGFKGILFESYEQATAEFESFLA